MQGPLLLLLAAFSNGRSQPACFPDSLAARILCGLQFLRSICSTRILNCVHGVRRGASCWAGCTAAVGQLLELASCPGWAAGSTVCLPSSRLGSSASRTLATEHLEWSPFSSMQDLGSQKTNKQRERVWLEMVVIAKKEAT